MESPKAVIRKATMLMEEMILFLLLLPLLLLLLLLFLMQGQRRQSRGEIRSGRFAGDHRGAVVATHPARQKRGLHRDLQVVQVLAQIALGELHQPLGRGRRVDLTDGRDQACLVRHGNLRAAKIGTTRLIDNIAV